MPDNWLTILIILVLAGAVWYMMQKQRAEKEDQKKEDLTEEPSVPEEGQVEETPEPDLETGEEVGKEPEEPEEGGSEEEKNY